MFIVSRGPAGTRTAKPVGDIVEVPFVRPRHRATVMEHSDYHRLREWLIKFLGTHAHRKKRLSFDNAAAAPDAAAE